MSRIYEMDDVREESEIREAHKNDSGSVEHQVKKSIINPVGEKVIGDCEQENK